MDISQWLNRYVDVLKATRKLWRESAVRDFDEARDLELQKLDRLEREAWAAWERSQKPAQSAVVSGEGAGKQTRKSMKNQHGDPRFLDAIHKCIAQRRALLGLDEYPLPAGPPVGGLPLDPAAQMARLREISRKLLDEPDYLDYLRQEALKEDAPGVVTIGEALPRDLPHQDWPEVPPPGS